MIGSILLAAFAIFIVRLLHAGMTPKQEAEWRKRRIWTGK